jgi:hypothetical protein
MRKSKQDKSGERARKGHLGNPMGISRGLKHIINNVD